MSMTRMTRRSLLTTGLIAGAGLSARGIMKLAGAHGFIPPDSGVLYGAGETLTYATARWLTRRSLAREFAPGQISEKPFANYVAPLGDGFQRLERAGFSDWRVAVDGLVAKPFEFSLADLKALPMRRQITSIACEEGWSYIAEWTGAPLSFILEHAEVSPQARYVVYRSIQPDWWDSIDMLDALHPQTILAVGMNGGELPVAFGGPLRLRVPRQLGYKSLKYLTHLTVTDSLKGFGEGLGSGAGGAESGYAWYAGI
jgi:DMSO/TMAO reductase YedYZ molybdopterin-dependent catalytic subunit